MTRNRAERPSVGPRVVLRLIGSRDFGAYFVGNALSASGTWFHSLAAGILIYRLTGSEFLLGVLTFSQFIPMLVLAPWSGSAADRFDRRQVVIVSQIAAAVLGATLAGLAWAGLASVGVVIGLSFGLGVAQTFTQASAGALLAQLVAPADLPSAVGLNSMTFNLARTVGPALAALAVTTLGIPAAFALNAGSYLALAVGVAVARPRPEPRHSGASTSLLDSLRLVRQRPRLAAYLAIVMLVGFAADPINTLAPAFAEEFGRPDTDAGYIIGVFGAGAVFAGVTLAGRIAGSRRRMIRTLTALSAGVALFAITPWFSLALVLLFVGGFGYLASSTGATSRLQLEVEDHYRGRIMALWTVAFLGLRPIASILDGAIAAAFGVRAAGVALALPALGAAIALAVIARPDLRPLGPRDRPAPPPAV